MQVTNNLNVRKNAAKSGAYASAPTKKSLYGLVNDSKLLDSTRLITEPGGAGHSPSTGAYPAQSNGPKAALPLNFKRALCSGLAPVEALSKDEVKWLVSKVLQAEPEWQVARNGKKGRSTDSETGSAVSSQSYQSSDRNFYHAQRPVSTKRNYSVSTGNRPLPAGKRLKKPPGPAIPERSNGGLEDTPCTVHEDSPLDDSINMKREFLEIWWQILGFTRQRRRLKQDDFVKALAAMGFTVRNRDGAQVSYRPPPNFESTKALTVHFPHGVNIEYTELKNKAKTIEKQYPKMVDMLSQRYEGMRSGE
ncbi:unnamed protein product [Rhizoctonia solani]|nr:unnamed protein product [Rhizoctonia solani]